jgi:hypothetical protein
MEMNGQLKASAALPVGKEPQYQLDRRLGEAQSHSEQHGEVKIIDAIATCGYCAIIM